MNVLQQIRKNFKGTDPDCAGFILTFNASKCAIVRKNGKYIFFSYNKIWDSFVRVKSIHTLNNCVDVITDYNHYKELKIEFKALSDEDLYYFL